MRRGKAARRRRPRPVRSGATPVAQRGLRDILWTMAAALPLIALSLGLLLFSVVPVVYDWSRMRQWEPVRAQVESASLQTHSTARGVTMYKAQVRYLYQIQGTPFTGARPLVDSSAESGGVRQRELVARLERAQRSGATVRVWVNPARPAESVVDRSFPAASVVWDMLIVALSGGAGGYVLLFLVRLVRDVRQPQRSAGRATRPADAGEQSPR